MSLRVARTLFAALAFTGPLFAQPAGGGIVVHLADGTSLMLHTWSLTYEYAASRRGEPPTFGSTARREAQDLWVGKKAFPLPGRTLEIVYAEENHPVGGTLQKVPVARGFVLVSQGKRDTLKAEPPHPDLLARDASGLLVQARALDLHGETIAGTKREFCLLSYSALVECPVQADQRVVKIQFQP